MRFAGRLCLPSIVNISLSRESMLEFIYRQCEVCAEISLVLKTSPILLISEHGRRIPCADVSNRFIVIPVHVMEGENRTRISVAKISRTFRIRPS